MRLKNVGLLLALAVHVALNVSQAFGAATNVYIENPGFEDGFNGWQEVNPDSSSESGDSYTGMASAKVVAGGKITQTVLLIPETNYVLTAHVQDDGTVGIELADASIESTPNSLSR